MRPIHKIIVVMVIAQCGVIFATSRSGPAQPSTASDATAPGATRTKGHEDVSMFASSSECLACHNRLTAPDGEDVSIGASWRGTMMANSARDPYVRASVRRETIDHPSRAAGIEDECSACHLPAAHQIARAAGGHGRVFEHLSQPAAARTPIDDLGRDGVTCTVCHQIASDRLGTPESFNGRFVVAAPLANGRRRAFGPLNPDTGRRRIKIGRASCRERV